MKKTILDVLTHLFEHYFDEEMEMGLDQEYLRSELIEAGFEEAEVNGAFEWLQSMASENTTLGRAPINSAIRVYTRREMEKIDLKSRGFLLFLEQIGVLEHVGRELVIDKLMALDADDIDLDQVKWVVLMVLFNHADQHQDFFWMESLVRGELNQGFH
jgi:Smg protein